MSSSPEKITAAAVEALPKTKVPPEVQKVADLQAQRQQLAQETSLTAWISANILKPVSKALDGLKADLNKLFGWGEEKADKVVEAVGTQLAEWQEKLAAPAAPVFSFLKGVAAPITSRFGDRIDPMDPAHKKHNDHHGIDIGVHEGTPIFATKPGKIISSKWNNGSGNVVEFQIDGDPRIYTFHHLQVPGPAKGTVIQPGDQLGISGHTGGRSTGPHLHFGVIAGRESIDPSSFLA